MEQKHKRKRNGIIGTLSMILALLLFVGLFAHIFDEQEEPKDNTSGEVEVEDIELLPEDIIF